MPPAATVRKGISIRITGFSARNVFQSSFVLTLDPAPSDTRHRAGRAVAGEITSKNPTRAPNRMAGRALPSVPPSIPLRYHSLLLPVSFHSALFAAWYIPAVYCDCTGAGSGGGASLAPPPRSTGVFTIGDMIWVGGGGGAVSDSASAFTPLTCCATVSWYCLT